MPERKITAEINGRQATITADIPDGASPEDINAAISAYAEANPKQFSGPTPSMLKDFQDRAMGTIGSNVSGMAGAIADPRAAFENEGKRIAQHVHNSEYDFNHGNYGQSLWNAVKSTPLVGGAIERTTDRIANGQWPELTGDVMTGRLLSGPGRGMKGTASSGVGTATMETAAEILKNQKLQGLKILPWGIGSTVTKLDDMWKTASAKTKATTQAVATAERIAKQKAGQGAPNKVMDTFKAKLPEVVAKAKAEEAAALATKQGAEIAKTVNGAADEFQAKRGLEKRVSQAEVKTTKAKESMAAAAQEKGSMRAGSQAERVAEAAEKAKAAAKAEADALAKKQGFELAQAAEKQAAAQTAEAKMQARLGVAATKEAGVAQELSATEAARLARQAERQAKVRATLAP